MQGDTRLTGPASCRLGHVQSALRSERSRCSGAADSCRQAPACDGEPKFELIFNKAFEYARNLVADGKAHGLAMALGKDGRVIARRAYGASAPTTGEGGLRPGQPIDPDRSIFEVASITKPFTVLAVLQLIERGSHISLDTPLASVVPAFGGHPQIAARSVHQRDAVTLRHLMCHTAGLADGVSVDRSCQPSLAAHVAATCEKMGLAFCPGTNIAYSSAGSE
eukprot:SAG31_NODE_806_length_11957_cov_2.232670_17_plen_222_part_00